MCSLELPKELKILESEMSCLTDLLSKNNVERLSIPDTINTIEQVHQKTQEELDNYLEAKKQNEILLTENEKISESIRKTQRQIVCSARIQATLDKEIKFMNDFIENPKNFVSKFQPTSQTTTPTLHMLQQLNLRLEAALA